MKKIMKCLLPTCILNKIAYVGNKLSTCFQVKDVTEFKDNHDIIYQGRCPKIGCNDYYLGETTTMQISSKFIWGTCELISVVLTYLDILRYCWPTLAVHLAASEFATQRSYF